MKDFQYHIEKKGEEVILRLEGNILGDVEVSAEIGAQLKAYIDQGVRKCIIDLHKVSFMNSSGLGLLISVLTKFRNKGGDVSLVGVSESVKKLLIITKLNSIFG